MTLFEQLQDDMKNAMKAHDSARVSTLRLLISSVKKVQIDGMHTLSDAEVIEVLRKEVKQRNDSIKQYAAGGRDDLVAGEQVELDIINEYLPALMTEEQVRDVVQKHMVALNVTLKSDKGKLMGGLMKELKGKADGGMVNTVVESLLK